MEKSKMDQAEKYLIHCSGVYTMLAWLDEQKQAGTPCTITKQTIYIHTLANRYFALGISRNNKLSKIPFLAMQPNETAWIKLIQWEKLVVRKKDMHLYLVSKLVKGDGTEYPDIPPFAMAISFDVYDKIQLLEQVDLLEGREFFQENGIVKINYHSTIFNLPLEKLPYDHPYLKDEKVTNYTDLMNDKEEQLQTLYSTDMPPEFKGEIAHISGTEDLFDKLKKKLL